ncbi:MAG TPA: branched-chain amino acid ABC transporter permease [Vineibacter sp.]|nr:branched-chain amino acid ABC transporter permease [Vineibacter sp.]
MKVDALTLRQAGDGDKRLSSVAPPLLILLGAAGAMALLPLVLGPYGLRVATTACMYLALAQSWNLIGGYAGLVSLAHPAFIGTGAVAAAICLINGLPIAVAVVVALALSLAIALLVGTPTLRLQGHYFVVATLLVSEALRNFVLNVDAFGFQGGVSVNIVSHVGISALGSDAYNRFFYHLMLGLAVAAMAVVLAFDRSRWGLALRTIRDNEAAAAALGVAAARLKLAVFLISAGMASLIGTASAFWIGTIETNDAYSLVITFEVIVMVFLGGRGTLWGPAIGVGFVLLLNEMIGVEFAEVTQVVSGLIVVLIVLFLPDGLMAALTEGPKALSWQRLRENVRRYRVS